MTIPMIVRNRYAGVKKMTFKAARANLSAHLKYIEHRKRSETETRDDRRIFNEQEDVINRKNAIDDVMKHTSRQDAYYHKLMLSPGPDIPVDDYRQWTRNLMRDLEAKQGKKLHWYAVQHKNTDHDHVHIVIAGAGESLSTGEEQAVFLRSNDDFAFLKERGREHSDYKFLKTIQQTVQELNRLDTLGQPERQQVLER